MKIALVTHYTPNFQTMANLTVPGKKIYAEKHGYIFFEQTDNWFVYPQRHIGYEKCVYLNWIMTKRSDIEWFWWTGCDVLITNHNIKIESLIDNNYHFIVCKDPTGINADSFLIRNTEIGREYMEHLGTEHPGGSEQGHMWDDERVPKYREITKYLPQHTMNSYDMAHYSHMGKNDQLGGRANWKEGDLALHAVTGLLPGFSLEQIYNWKMKILESKIDQVIK